MAVHYVSHHDAREVYRMHHVPNIFIVIQSTCKNVSEMIKFPTNSRAGKYDIETGPEHYLDFSSWALHRKINFPSANIMRIHWRGQETVPIRNGSNHD